MLRNDVTDRVKLLKMVEEPAARMDEDKLDFEGPDAEEVSMFPGIMLTRLLTCTLPDQQAEVQSMPIPQFQEHRPVEEPCDWLLATRRNDQ